MKSTSLLMLLFLLPGCGSQNIAILPTSEAAKRAAAESTMPMKTLTPPLPTKPGK